MSRVVFLALALSIAAAFDVPNLAGTWMGRDQYTHIYWELDFTENTLVLTTDKQVIQGEYLLTKSDGGNWNIDLSVNGEDAARHGIFYLFNQEKNLLLALSAPGVERPQGFGRDVISRGGVVLNAQRGEKGATSGGGHTPPPHTQPPHTATTGAAHHSSSTSSSSGHGSSTSTTGRPHPITSTSTSTSGSSSGGQNPFANVHLRYKYAWHDQCQQLVPHNPVDNPFPRVFHAAVMQMDNVAELEPDRLHGVFNHTQIWPLFGKQTISYSLFFSLRDGMVFLVSSANPSNLEQLQEFAPQEPLPNAQPLIRPWETKNRVKCASATLGCLTVCVNL